MLVAEVKPTFYFESERSTFLVCVALSQVVGFAGKLVSSMHTTGNCSNLPKVLDPCHWDLTKVGLMVPPFCPFMYLLGDTKRKMPIQPAQTYGDGLSCSPSIRQLRLNSVLLNGSWLKSSLE